jgi:hypothetical protein
MGTAAASKSFLPVIGVLVAGLLSSGAALAADGSAEGRSRVAATLYGYSVPDEPDFLMLVAPADIRWLHIEARYNYEDLRTGSFFVGTTGRSGDRVKLEGTAMVGGVFGTVDGVAPALRFTLLVWKIDFFIEAEYVIDLRDTGASFFYSWSELGVSPLPRLRLGLIGQRTRVIANDLEFQRGVFVGVNPIAAITLTAYVLNLGWISPTYVGAFGVAF